MLTLVSQQDGKREQRIHLQDLHEQEITSLQELSFGVLPYTSSNVLVKPFFHFQTVEWIENNF